MLETAVIVILFLSGLLIVLAIWLKGKFEDVNAELYKAQSRIYSLEYRVKDLERGDENSKPSAPSTEIRRAQAAAPTPPEEIKAEAALGAIKVSEPKSPWESSKKKPEDGDEETPKYSPAPNFESEREPVQSDGPDLLDYVKGYFAENMASKAFVWLGGFALIFAGFFLAKYSIELGLVTPLRRVVFTAVFAAAMAIAAEIFHRKGKSKLIAGVLYAAAIAVAYGDFYAASGYYGLIPIKLGIAGMILCGTAATALSFRYGQHMLLMAIAGVFLAPAILRTDSPNTILLTCYLAVMTAAGVAVSVKAQKALPYALTLFANAAWMALWFVEIRQFEHISWVFGYMAAASCLFYFTTPKMGFAEKPLFDGSDTTKRGFLTRELPMLAAALTCFGASLGIGLKSAMPLADAAFFPLFCGIIFALSPKNGIMRAASFLALVLLSLFLPIVIPGSAANIIIPCVFGGAVAYFAIMTAYSEYKKTFAGLMSIALVANLFLCVLILPETADMRLRFLSFNSFACLFSMAAALGGALATRHNARPLCPIRIAMWGLGIAAVFYWEFTGVPAAFYFCAVTAFFSILSFRMKNAVWQEGSFFCIILLIIASYAEFPISNYLYGIPILFRQNGILEPFALCGFAMAALGAVHLKLGGTRMSAVLLAAVSICFALNAAGLTSLAWPETGLPYYTAISQGVAVLCACAFAFAVCGAKLKIKPVYAAGAILFSLTAARVFATDIFLKSPVFHKIYVAGWPGANLLFLTMLLPAIMLAIWGVIEKDAQWRKFIFAASIALLFIFANFELRFCFQGNLMNSAASAAEIYAYSPLWLVFGIALLAAGFWKKSAALRTASLFFILVAVCKVFLYDASALDGLLRVLSFALLGVCLIGIGFFYAKFVFKNADNSV